MKVLPLPQLGFDLSVFLETVLKIICHGFASLSGENESAVHPLFWTAFGTARLNLFSNNSMVYRQWQISLVPFHGYPHLFGSLIDLSVCLS